MSQKIVASTTTIRPRLTTARPPPIESRPLVPSPSLAAAVDYAYDQDYYYYDDGLNSLGSKAASDVKVQSVDEDYDHFYYYSDDGEEQNYLDFVEQPQPRPQLPSPTPSMAAIKKPPAPTMVTEDYYYYDGESEVAPKTNPDYDFEYYSDDAEPLSRRVLAHPQQSQQQTEAPSMFSRLSQLNINQGKRPSVDARNHKVVQSFSNSLLPYLASSSQLLYSLLPPPTTNAQRKRLRSRRPPNRRKIYTKPDVIINNKSVRPWWSNAISKRKQQLENKQEAAAAAAGASLQRPQGSRLRLLKIPLAKEGGTTTKRWRKRHQKKKNGVTSSRRMTRRSGEAFDLKPSDSEVSRGRQSRPKKLKKTRYGMRLRKLIKGVISDIDEIENLSTKTTTMSTTSMTSTTTARPTLNDLMLTPLMNEEEEPLFEVQSINLSLEDLEDVPANEDDWLSLDMIDEVKAENHLQSWHRKLHMAKLAAWMKARAQEEAADLAQSIMQMKKNKQSLVTTTETDEYDILPQAVESKPEQLSDYQDIQAPVKDSVKAALNASAPSLINVDGIDFGPEYDDFYDEEFPLVDDAVIPYQEEDDYFPSDDDLELPHDIIIHDAHHLEDKLKNDCFLPPCHVKGAFPTFNKGTQSYHHDHFHEELKYPEELHHHVDFHHFKDHHAHKKPLYHNHFDLHHYSDYGHRLGPKVTTAFPNLLPKPKPKYGPLVTKLPHLLPKKPLPPPLPPYIAPPKKKHHSLNSLTLDGLDIVTHHGSLGVHFTPPSSVVSSTTTSSPPALPAITYSTPTRSARPAQIIVQSSTSTTTTTPQPLVVLLQKRKDEPQSLPHNLQHENLPKHYIPPVSFSSIFLPLAPAAAALEERYYDTNSESVVASEDVTTSAAQKGDDSFALSVLVPCKDPDTGQEKQCLLVKSRSS